MIESIFFVLVALLLVLAALDLFVGVSNDAVNFLNSAIGTKIAPLFVIMGVASLGILIGSAFSSGMMEVARKGLFHPELFTFKEVMFIFSAVMIADIILLNVFNSLGLPTSTTVSIIFELLGAAVFAAWFKLNQQGLSFLEIAQYVKTDKTATIVSAIILSVVISFISGMIVQFICRTGFSFKLDKSVKYLGGIFTGFSLTAIVYFLIIKGLKGTSFVEPEWLDYIKANTTTILWFMFGTFFILGQILTLANVNIFRIIVLSGTFSLAFAFAGNDLVNFVGVPLAALDAYLDWYSSGADVNEYLMTSLDSSSRVNTMWLVASGIIMCITLWTSKKARRVIKTSINLSSSTQGQKEQFGANPIGRAITRFGLGIANNIYKFLPNFFINFVATRYRKNPTPKGQEKLPFDYVRASINLVVASALISVATSFKLPLSTTYVTFMVAMGSSFADGAWNRESAVYRISGVITVVSGWFLTGICAFTAACFVSLALFYFDYFALFSLTIVTFVLIAYSNFIKKDEQDVINEKLNNLSDEKILSAVSANMTKYLDSDLNILKDCLNCFYGDNENGLRKVLNEAARVNDEVYVKRSYYYDMSIQDSVKVKDSLTVDAKFFYYQTLTNIYDASTAAKKCSALAYKHIANRHSIFGGDLKVALSDVLKRFEKLSKEMKKFSLAGNAGNLEEFVKIGRKLNNSIDECQIELVSILSKEKVSVHSSDMFLNFLQTIRDITNRYLTVCMQQQALYKLVMISKESNQVDSDNLPHQIVDPTLN